MMLPNAKTIELVGQVKYELTRKCLEFRPLHQLFFIIVDPQSWAHSVIHPPALMDEISAILNRQGYEHDPEELPEVVVELRKTFLTVHASDPWKVNRAF